jgi:iron(III) transport system substrate-binding protein
MMKLPGISRRDVLKGTGAVLVGAAFSTRVMADAPPAEPVTPALIEAARKEGQVIYYTSTDLPVAEKLAKAFEAKYPGIAVRVERTGAERVFQRIGQEYSSNIHAVDVVNSSDAAHFIVWKRDGILAPYVPEDVAKFYPADHRDPDGQFASFRVWLSIIAYNTNLVKAEDAPKSFADLLDLGERAVMADGNEYNIFQMKESGRPVEPVYATEGSPLIIGPNGIFKGSPNPNAAKLFQSFSLGREAQQLIIDVGGLRSVHAQTAEKAGRKPLKGIKTMKDDAAAVEKEGDSIKARYTKIFHV